MLSLDPFDDMVGMPTIEWTFERIARCERQIWRLAEQALCVGTDVIFDLGLAKVADRERFKAPCENAGFDYTFYGLDAEKTICSPRVLERNKVTGETLVFPVSTEISEMTDRMFEPPTEQELSDTHYRNAAERLSTET